MAAASSNLVSNTINNAIMMAKQRLIQCFVVNLISLSLENNKMLSYQAPTAKIIPSIIAFFEFFISPSFYFTEIKNTLATGFEPVTSRLTVVRSNQLS